MKPSSRVNQDIDEKLQFYKSAVIWDVSHDSDRWDNASKDIFRRRESVETIPEDRWEGFRRPSNSFLQFPSNNSHSNQRNRSESKRAAPTSTLQNSSSLWSRFARDTTFHGIRRMENPDESKFSRIAWVLIVCTMAGILVFNVANLMVEYYQYNTVTKSDIKIVPTFPFPSVTLCNLCPFKDVDKDPNSGIYEYLLKASFFRDGTELNTSRPEVRELLDMRMDLFHERHAYVAEELFFSAEYDSRPINVTEAFEVMETYLGRCFTFNGPKYIEKYGVRQATRDGRYAGLHIYVKLHQDRYFVFDDLTAGVRMFISHHPQTPRYFKDGIEIHPGTSTRVALRPIKYTFLPEPYKSYGEETCEQRDSSDLTYKMVNATFYSYENCIEQCRLYKASVNCSCYTMYLYVDGLPVCTVRQTQNCILPSMATISSSLCDCPRPCTFTTFDMQMSASQMPSRKSAALILALTNETSIPSVRENYLDLRVFMDSMLIRHERHEAQYTFNSIFAFLGGQMGFFIGASLITLVEVFETMVKSVYLFLAAKVAHFDLLGTRVKASKETTRKAWR